MTAPSGPAQAGHTAQEWRLCSCGKCLQISAETGPPIVVVQRGEEWDSETPTDEEARAIAVTLVREHNAFPALVAALTDLSYWADRLLDNEHDDEAWDGLHQARQPAHDALDAATEGAGDE